MADVLAVRNTYQMENWSALIQECNASGLSNREFCQQRGISEKKLLLLAEEISESSGRCGIDGLSAIVTQQYAGQLSEEMFCGRWTDRIKALYWSGDDTSYCTNDDSMGNSNGHGLNRSFGS